MKTKSVIVKNNTKYEIDGKLFEKIFNIISNYETIKNEKHIVNLLLVKDDEMKRFNSFYRKSDEATDVLSFEDNLEFSPVLGDIIINVEQANRQKIETLSDELAILFIHAILHLVGYDHLNREEEKIMKKKEEIYYTLCKEL